LTKGRRYRVVDSSLFFSRKDPVKEDPDVFFFRAIDFSFA